MKRPSNKLDPRPISPRAAKKRLNAKKMIIVLVISIVSIEVLLLIKYQSTVVEETSTPDARPVSNDTQVVVKIDALPKWIENYFAWHKEMRARFPGKSLFTDPEAPNILLRTCLGLCGGLNDRLGQLPWDLYLANQTQRLYLIRWERPRPLENFFIPNEIDWSVPEGVEGFGDMHAVRAITPLFQDYADDRPDAHFWESDLDRALRRAGGEFYEKKVLRHRLLGHLNEGVLEERLRALGETDMIHYTPTFGRIFRAFFRASPGVEAQLNDVYHSLKLEPGKYTAVHCRVRHPKAYTGLVKGKNENYPADKTGLPWQGATKDFAVDTATHAIQCARTLSKDVNEPVYFFSDSNDLVRYVAHELTNQTFVATNSSLFENTHDASLLKAVKATNILAREVSMENAHIDKQKGRKPHEYFGTFVDLLLAVNARCVTYGIGFYAIFATKISGTQCKLLYQEEEWGGIAGGKATEVCTRDRYKHF